MRRQFAAVFVSQIELFEMASETEVTALLQADRYLEVFMRHVSLGS